MYEDDILSLFLYLTVIILRVKCMYSTIVNTTHYWTKKCALGMFSPRTVRIYFTFVDFVKCLDCSFKVNVLKVEILVLSTKIK
jgi:hypothetical protein